MNKYFVSINDFIYVLIFTLMSYEGDYFPVVFFALYLFGKSEFQSHFFKEILKDRNSNSLGLKLPFFIKIINTRSFSSYIQALHHFLSFLVYCFVIFPPKLFSFVRVYNKTGPILFYTFLLLLDLFISS